MLIKTLCVGEATNFPAFAGGGDDLLSKPIVIPIEDVLDLHTFNPKDVPDLLEEYIRACKESGIQSVKIIHGKGSGVLKDRVQAILKRNRLVASFHDAPPEAGGWGATIVELMPLQ